MQNTTKKKEWLIVNVTQCREQQVVRLIQYIANAAYSTDYYYW